jgi:hypothetical protein
VSAAGARRSGRARLHLSPPATQGALLWPARLTARDAAAQDRRVISRIGQRVRGPRAGDLSRASFSEVPVWTKSASLLFVVWSGSDGAGWSCRLLSAQRARRMVALATNRRIDRVQRSRSTMASLAGATGSAGAQISASAGVEPGALRRASSRRPPRSDADGRVHARRRRQGTQAVVTGSKRPPPQRQRRRSRQARTA